MIAPGLPGDEGCGSVETHSSARLVRPQLVKHIGRGRSVAVRSADLAEEHRACAVQQKCRGICRLGRSIPAQSIQVCERVVRVYDEVNVSRKWLVRESLLRALAKIGVRPWINEQDYRTGVRESARIVDEIMHLALAVRTLVAGISAKHNQSDRALTQKTLQGSVALTFLAPSYCGGAVY